MAHGALAHSSRAPVTRRDGYRRRQPEQTVLYQTVAEHWPGFRERAEEAGGLPRFVVREFEEYLDCGILERGCLHLKCEECGYSQLVAFSCKRRGFCPSCIGRRMADMAVHLEQSVLPPVPVRHWICSFPWGLRALLGYDRALCADVVSAFAGELSRWLKWRAKRELGLSSVADARTGLLVALQRVDSALRLNVHLHSLALDGVYVRDAPDDQASPLTFHALPTPTHDEVADLCQRIAGRVERVLSAHGKTMQPGQADDGLDADSEQLLLESSGAQGLAACYAAAAQGVSVSGPRAGQPSLRLLVGQSARHASAGSANEPVAEAGGISLYGKQLVDGRDRPQLERLCRYITRPPVAQDRLTRRADGSLELHLKSVWKDGTRAIILEPHDLLTRLVAAVPPPRQHQLRYFGILSSHAKARAEVVPCPDTADSASVTPDEERGRQLELAFVRKPDERRDQSPDDDTPKPRKPWAWLLRHVFQADLQTCHRCGGDMRWVHAATAPKDIARLLAEHGLGPRPPPPPMASPPGQLRLALPLSS